MKEIYVRYAGIPLLALFMMTVTDHDSPYSFYVDYGFSLLFTFVYWNSLVTLYRFIRKKYPKIERTGTRLIITMSVIVSFVLIINPLIRLATGLIEVEDLRQPEVFFHLVPQIILVSFMIVSFYETAYSFEKYKVTVKQNEELKTQQSKAQLEVLKNQTSPHFLFNSLNTLSSLISDDPNAAQSFTDHLSDVYRYILQNNDKEIVRIKDELEFAHSYVFLMQMRYPQNLHVDIRLSKDIKDLYIAPLTLQILIENCLKHNAISTSNPLFIDIYSENKRTLLVKNNVKPKAAIEKSTKTGLSNIKKRYELLNDSKVEIIKTSTNFIVAIPLIEVESERKNHLQPVEA